MTETALNPTSVAQLGGAIPIFRVRSLEASLEHYTRVLGFQIQWQGPGIMGSVSRDRCSIMLCQGDQGHAGGWVWISVDDAERLFGELRAKGATIRTPPTNYPWAREIHVEDVDGNVLRFGSDPLPDQPFGEWRDMQNVAWAMGPDGSWQRADHA